MIATISSDNVQTISRHGEEAYPHECCGFLVGSFGDENPVITELLPAQNDFDGPRERRYLITPKDYMVAERAAAKSGRDIVGFYHSHPDHPARPSVYDRDHAWPRLCYIIVSVREGKAGDMTAWRLKDDRSGFDEAELAVKV